jgi:hypothetical protein
LKGKAPLCGGKFSAAFLFFYLHFLFLFAILYYCMYGYSAIAEYYLLLSHLIKEVSYMSYNFPVIDMAATGSNIKRLRLEKGLSVRQLQSYFGFDEPQAIYKWQRGESLPSVDNLYALGALLEVPMEHILVPMKSSLHIVNEQQDKTCCSVFLRKLF